MYMKIIVSHYYILYTPVYICSYLFENENI